MRTLPILAFAVATSLAASGAFAQTTTQPAQPQQNSSQANKEAPQAQAPPAATAGGMVVFIDPVTKKVRQPDAGEMEKLISQEKISPLIVRPLTVKAGPGRAVGVVLDRSFDVFMVVTKQPGGKLSMGCVTGQQNAAAAVANGSKAANQAAGKEASDVQ